MIVIIQTLKNTSRKSNKVRYLNVKKDLLNSSTSSNYLSETTFDVEDPSKSSTRICIKRIIKKLIPL